MARLQQAVRDEVLSDTRQALLDAAADEFARAGYTGANINRISTSAGFAKGTIYNHFASKQALMGALIDATAEHHVAAILTALEDADSAVAKLEAFFQAGFAFVEAHPAPARVVINAVYGPSDDFKARVYQAYQPLFDALIRDVLGAGIARGELRDLDPNTTAAMIMTIYLGSCSQLDDCNKIWVTPAQVMDFVTGGLRGDGS